MILRTGSHKCYDAPGTWSWMQWNNRRNMYVTFIYLGRYYILFYCTYIWNVCYGYSKTYNYNSILLWLVEGLFLRISSGYLPLPLSSNIFWFDWPFTSLRQRDYWAKWELMSHDIANQNFRTHCIEYDQCVSLHIR